MEGAEEINETEAPRLKAAENHSGPESPGTARTMNDAIVTVEELTLNNFKYPNMSLPGPSNCGSEKKMKSYLWQNFYKLENESSDKIPRESISMENGMGVGSFSPNLLGTRRFSAQKHSEQSNPNVFEHLSGTENILANSTTAFSMGVRTKVTPSSGFPQFLANNTLKSTGVAYRHLGPSVIPEFATKTDDVKRISRVSIKGLPGKLHHSAKALPAKLQDHSAKADNIPPLNGNGAVSGSDLVASNCSHGISLRQLLRPGKHKINMVERHQIFKQVVELVDCSHFKGLALQNLQPSYFMVLPSNHVKYAGSFITQTWMEHIGCVTSQATDHCHLSNKRKRKQHSENSDLSLVKHLNLNEDNNVSSGPSSLRDVLGREFPKGFDIANYIVGYSVFDPRQHPVLEEDHQPKSGSSVTTMLSDMTLEGRWYSSPEELNGGSCSFNSNIYSLGVLLFELFCCFESQEVHATAMLDLRERILPPVFLSESPREAGFCLWLLHPEPSSRPKAREVLLCDIVSKTQNMTDEQSSASFDEEDAEADLLLHFLLTMKEQKERQTEKLLENLGCLRMDIEEVQKRHLSRIGHLSSEKSSINKQSDESIQKEPLYLGSMSPTSKTYLNEERLMKNLHQLENAYFSVRSRIEQPETNDAECNDKDVLINCEKHLITQNDDEQNMVLDSDCLGNFFDGLCKYARYNRLEVCGTLRNGDILNSANVICSLSFDRDEEYFAAAGVARKIKIFEYASLLNDNVDIHYPVVEMSSKSNLSCVCWNSYIKNYLASTEYDGTVQLWDASTGQGLSRFTEHQRRAWSVDFSRITPTKFASGSDDCSVKLWSINEKNCINTIRNVANVCCVQFSAHSSNLLTFGSADYKIYGYDLRNTRIPWCTLVGHGKAVSYVKFVDSGTLVSASTDNTLKLWDLNKTSSSGLSTHACTLTFSGHTNEKNFVGLSVANGYISCGSETNEVYAYYKSLPMPITSHKFGSVDPISGQEIGDYDGQFVSSVCWRERSDMVVAANSTGCIKLLQML